ncbi:succinyl-CoA synthetase subunit beta [Candidatus Brocadiaceae bacterium B188]|jgi:acetyl-CoA synthetase (ADP-forming)|nr:succinyl-CoA synthetase subunit beta [Candidatus Brocadiaceae bacterium B188]
MCFGQACIAAPNVDELMANLEKTVYSVIQKALLQKRYELLEPEAKDLVEAFGIKTTKHRIASSHAEAIQVARSLGYPVALKIVSPDVSHKTDVGGVRLGIGDDNGVRDAYDEILRNVTRRVPDARIHGVLVQEMATPSTEVIVGGVRDPQFGPAVMFGLGGIFVEVFQDVSFRIAPVEEYEALDMIQCLKGVRVLKGFRNREAADITALAQAIVRVSDIMVAVEEIKEIDLNPILVYSKGAKAVDARIILCQP